MIGTPVAYGLFGVSYVVFGRDTASGGLFPQKMPLADLDGTNGFVVRGSSFQERSSSSSDSAGDVNNDGIDDLLVGAPRARRADGARSGFSYVLFGRDTISGASFPATFRLRDIDGENGFRMEGIEGVDRTGDSVAGAGDVNGDGIDDLIIGAPGACPGGLDNAGSSFVLFGRDVANCAADIDGDGRLTLWNSRKSKR
ncbi:MAG: integrin alpha, partial [Planctomycetota bacterium]